jgi:hypothetical protein
MDISGAVDLSKGVATGAKALIRMGGAAAPKLTRLIKSGSGDVFRNHIDGVAKKRLLAVPGLTVDTLKQSKSKGIADRIGSETDVEKALNKLTTDDIHRLVNENNVSMTLLEEDFPEDLLHLGYRPIPHFDYSKGVDQLKRTVANPVTGEQVRLMDLPEVQDAFEHNWGVTHGLWRNPSSPTYNRVVGLETDPVKIDQALTDAQLRAASFYPEYENDIVTQIGGENSGLSQELWTGVRGPTSKSTMPRAEQKHNLNMAERTDHMFDTTKLELGGVRDYDRFGPNVSRMGKDSSMHALETIMAPRNAFDDPRLLQKNGDVVKMGSYIRNILNRLRKYKVPGYKDPQLVVTMDSNHNFAGLGGLRPMGGASHALTNDQEVYNFLSDVTRRAADKAGYGAAPADFQASLWATIRELLESQVEGFVPIGRAIQFAPEWEAALRTKNRDVRPLFNTARQQFARRFGKELEVAQALKDPEKIAGAQSRLNAGLARLENMKKINPELKALLAITGVGAGGYAANKNKTTTDSPASAALNRMGVRNQYGY